MKKLALIMAAMMMVMALAGCSKEQDPDVAEEEIKIEEAVDVKTQMIPVGEFSNSFRYYYDSVTGVMYIRYQGNRSGGLTVMMDPVTGGPLTYENYKAMAEGTRSADKNSFPKGNPVELNQQGKKEYIQSVEEDSHALETIKTLDREGKLEYIQPVEDTTEYIQSVDAPRN